MANTYTCLHYHLIFSTKNREQWISRVIEQRVWEYLGGIARQNSMKALQIGGIEDHVHLVIGVPPALAVSKALQLFKGGSSRWIHETFPELARFQWQDGYGAFTVSKSQLPEVVHYVAQQRVHHRLSRSKRSTMRSCKCMGLITMNAMFGARSSFATRRRIIGAGCSRALKRPATVERPLRGQTGIRENPRYRALKRPATVRRTLRGQTGILENPLRSEIKLALEGGKKG